MIENDYDLQAKRLLLEEAEITLDYIEKIIRSRLNIYKHVTQSLIFLESERDYDFDSLDYEDKLIKLQEEEDKNIEILDSHTEHFNMIKKLYVEWNSLRKQVEQYENDIKFYNQMITERNEETYYLSKQDIPGEE